MADRSDTSSGQQTLTLQEALDLGVQHHSAGDLPKAEDIYNQILESDPNQPVALHYLGVIAHQTEHYEKAVELITRVLKHQPDYAEAHNNLGNIHKDLGNLEQAQLCFRKAIHLTPNLAETHYNLGNVYLDLGQISEAITSFQMAVEIDPINEVAHNNLGNALQKLGKLDDAVVSYQKALTINSGFTNAHYNLGVTFRELKRFDEAVSCYRKVLEIDPEYAEAYNNLGNVFFEQGRLEEAVESYQRAISIRSDYVEAYNNLGILNAKNGYLEEAQVNFRSALEIHPEFADALYNLGNTLRDLGLFDEALSNYHKVLAIHPDNSNAHGNLGYVFMYLGQFDAAIASYEKALAIRPENIDAGKNLLLLRLYIPGITLKELFSKHTFFSEKHTREILTLEESFANDPITDRRLRVGYLSSDFHNHPVGHNVLPLLSSHDHKKFEVYCYTDILHADDITSKIRSSVDHWKSVKGKSDLEVARQVRADRIDILVCLAGHLRNNRPLVCAYRAAPVQVSFHDLATSGLEEMDYWLTDNFLHPPDTKEMFTEIIYRLPVFYQYSPIQDSPPVVSPPSEFAGFVTFGSFNNPAKVNMEVIKLWSEVLSSVPDSQLVLKYLNWYDQSSLRESMIKRFAACGIKRDRIKFITEHDTMSGHLGHYSEIDIALDPFPYNGATTTFQSLWMGVPVVSLAGNSFCSRAAGSILYHSGFEDLVADTSATYVAIACDLARDPVRLKTLRATLRKQIATSSLCDPSIYAVNVEAAFREMWETWCAKAGEV